MKPFFLSFIFWLFLQNGILPLTAFSQSNSVSQLGFDSAYILSMRKLAEDQFKKDSESASGPYKKYIRDIYKERYDYIKSCFDNGAIISDQAAVAYLNTMVQQILTGNPFLQSKNPRVLLFKAWWPNASSMGEGTILCNIGLMYKVRNEAQLVFVLCHEMAHLWLDHGNKNIEKYVNTVYDDEFQKELKQISKMQYEKNRRLDELEKGIAFNSRRHSRAKESEADSMAIELMKNTPYSLEEAKSALAMLDSIDNDKYDIEPPLRKYFNHPSFPFRDSWMKEEESFFGGATLQEPDKKIVDSLKTHPDCSKRVGMVTPLIARTVAKGQAANLQATELERWQKAYDYEVIAYTFERKYLSLSLYYALQTIEKYPNDPWLLAIIGNCLNRMFEAQKKHELSRYIDLPSPYQEKKYNDFLRFIQNLSLSDIASLNYYFLESYKEKSLGNEDFVYALIRSKENAGKPDEKKQWIQYYQTNFSKPRYTIQP